MSNCYFEEKTVSIVGHSPKHEILGEISFCNVVDEILIFAVNLKSFVFFGHEGDVKKKSFNIYKSQMQGISLSIWGFVHKELGFNYQS